MIIKMIAGSVPRISETIESMKLIVDIKNEERVAYVTSLYRRCEHINDNFNSVERTECANEDRVSISDSLWGCGD